MSPANLTWSCFSVCFSQRAELTHRNSSEAVKCFSNKPEKWPWRQQEQNRSERERLHKCAPHSNPYRSLNVVWINLKKIHCGLRLTNAVRAGHRWHECIWETEWLMQHSAPINSTPSLSVRNELTYLLLKLYLLHRSLAFISSDTVSRESERSAIQA